MTEKRHLTVRLDESDDMPRIFVDGTDIQVVGIIAVDLDWHTEKSYLIGEVTIMTANGKMLESVRRHAGDNS